MLSQSVSNYSFRRGDLNIHSRECGISAFMRIRNGAEFLEPTIRSHIDYFDEIVAVYNQCNDRTPEILARLALEFGPKLRVFNYIDRVYPPGSDDHAKTPPNSPNSLVNYYNFAMAQTRFRTVTKLDDDHIAISKNLASICQNLRQSAGAHDKFLGFSGLNLWRDKAGEWGIYKDDPISGGGDIGFFDVREDRIFTHDKRFERGPRVGLKRQFSGFLYWHLKYMKAEYGFANYELSENLNSRYLRRYNALNRNDTGIQIDELAAKLKTNLLARGWAFISSKAAFKNKRNASIGTSFSSNSVSKAYQDSVDQTYHYIVRDI